MNRKLIRKEQNYQMNQMTKSEMEGTLNSDKTSYYYPSERQNTCCGKGAFKQRFPILIAQDSQCFCSKLCSFLCFFISHERKNIPKDQQELQRLLPITNPIFTTEQNKITYTWIGHSTAVISIGKQANIMIDPVFSLRCSPFQWIGPQRYRQPSCKINNLPQIHAVFVSHDHFDHLDQTSLKDLQQLHHPIFVAGLDSKDSFPEGCKLQQLDWTETKTISINGEDYDITFVPVCHWSKRKIHQKNTRLWGGFVIKTPKGQKIFYAGDTGYCQIFKELGQIFGPIDLCIIPIGAYEPRKLLAFAHIDPEQAVIMHKQLKSKKSVGVHWGTFPLGFEHYYQPKLDLQKAKIKHNLKSDQFITIGHGEEFSIDYL